MNSKQIKRRREFLEMAAGLTAAGSLLEQDAEASVVRAKAKMVVVAVVVTEGNRYIKGLKHSDFRVFEDGIPQKIFTFAEGDKPPLLVNDDGTTKPLADGKFVREAGKFGLDLRQFESIRADLDNSYTITYHPDPSNHKEGFRRISIEIVPDTAKKWTAKHRPGYWPERRTPEADDRGYPRP